MADTAERRPVAAHDATLALLGLLIAVSGCARTPDARSARPPDVVSLPKAAPGIGFDDLRYSLRLHRLLVPSGRSGRLTLIDPDTLAQTSLGGFSSSDSYSGGHDDGPTSVDEAGAMLYVTDRTSRTLLQVDPVGGRVLARAKLAAEPDYVRFVAPTNEVWITQPGAEQIQIFDLKNGGDPRKVGTIAIADGPESLVIDVPGRRAYTHRWHKTTVALDLASRSIVAEWPNGCVSSRGIALDEAHGWLFSSCSEGTVSVLDVRHDGHMLSKLVAGAGFDVMGYSQKLGHVYLAGGACRCLAMLGVSAKGELSLLERASAPESTHCAVADDIGHAWVCDPDRGSLLRFRDQHPESP
jgi:hypothetical protein